MIDVENHTVTVISDQLLDDTAVAAAVDEAGHERAR
jgi:hypothetical protein